MSYIDCWVKIIIQLVIWMNILISNLNKIIIGYALMIGINKNWQKKTYVQNILGILLE